jgi:hypothetical protein
VDERPLSCVSCCECPGKSKIRVFSTTTPFAGRPGTASAGRIRRLCAPTGNRVTLASTAHAPDPTPFQTTRLHKTIMDSSNLPAPKTFAPSREDVLSTLGFFFGDPGTPDALWEPKNCQLLCTGVCVAGTADADRCFACVCRVSFVTAVPEKLKVRLCYQTFTCHHAPTPPTSLSHLLVHSCTCIRNTGLLGAPRHVRTPARTLRVS